MEKYQWLGVMTILLAINTNVVDYHVSETVSFIVTLIFAFMFANEWRKASDKS